MHDGIPIPARLAEVIVWAAVFDHVGSVRPDRPPLLEDALEPAEQMPETDAHEDADGVDATAESLPVTTWAAVARAVGHSVDTMARRRKAWGIEAKKPHFDNAEEARRWYRRCEHQGTGLEPHTPVPRPVRASGRKSRGTKGLTLADLETTRGKRR